MGRRQRRLLDPQSVLEQGSALGDPTLLDEQTREIGIDQRVRWMLLCFAGQQSSRPLEALFCLRRPPKMPLDQAEDSIGLGCFQWARRAFGHGLGLQDRAFSLGVFLKPIESLGQLSQGNSDVCRRRCADIGPDRESLAQVSGGV